MQTHPRPLRVLRHHRELASPLALPHWGVLDLAEVAAAPLERGAEAVELVDRALRAVPALPGHRGPLAAASLVARPRLRGAGCGKSARPDLWEARVGNDPGPPDLLTRGERRLACLAATSRAPRRCSFGCGSPR